MKRFGAAVEKMHDMTGNEMFLLRLQLMIVVVKGALKGYPVGEHRKKAAIENAAVLHRLIPELDLTFLNLKTASHLFRERVKLLSIMATAIVSEDYPLGIHRREAILENVDRVIDGAFPEKKLSWFHDVLKVA